VIRLGEGICLVSVGRYVHAEGDLFEGLSSIYTINRGFPGEGKTVKTGVPWPWSNPEELVCGR